MLSYFKCFPATPNTYFFILAWVWQCEGEPPADRRLGPRPLHTTEAVNDEIEYQLGDITITWKSDQNF